MEKKCIICDKTFNVKKSHFDRRKCCSKKCHIEKQKKETGSFNNNYKGGVKTQICNYCKKDFIPNNPYQKRKFCSHKCASDSTIGRKVILHENTLKAIENKKILGLNNPDKKCKCGNKKEIKSKLCVSCFKKSIERVKECVVCKKEFNPNSKIIKTCSKECNKIHLKVKTKGENNPNWKGGIQTENNRQRSTDDYKFWRISVFERDNYKCQDCGIVGGKLHAHHIKYFSLYPELRTELNNGITLCEKCHRKTHRKK